MFSICLFFSFLYISIGFTQALPAVDYDKKQIAIGITAEPASLNSAISSELMGNFLLNHLTEGLVSYNEQQQIVEAVAYKWELKGNRAHFWLRKEAKWSDGSTVIAQDFISAWQYALDPKTASPYAFILFPIKNAEAINQGLLSPEKLALEAPNPFELIVYLDKPCPFFIALTAIDSFRPIKSEQIKQWGLNYATDQ